jgi:acetylornithine deacetylase/succinyl-diaminopimelate desuccinylase-like protein
MPRIWAVEAYLATIGPLPCRVRFLVEGEEEYGSEHFDALLDQRPGIRQVEGALIEGGGVDLSGRPEITPGVRGMAVIELVCRTIAYDAHSSVATIVPSAPVRLSQALSSMYDTDGFPAVPGLDAGIVPPSAAQLAIVDATPLDVVDEIREEYGVKRLLGGLDGTAAIRAMTFSPTLNIQGLWSGFIGPGDKTITPAEAHARLDIRIVPDQDPESIATAIRAHLAAGGFDDIEVIAEQGERPYWTPSDHPIVEAATRVSEAVFGLPATRYVSMPGTAPMWQVCGRDQVPTTSLGGGSADCRAHAPNENVRLDYAAKAAQLTARFLDEFAALE